MMRQIVMFANCHGGDGVGVGGEGGLAVDGASRLERSSGLTRVSGLYDGRWG